MTPPGIRKDQDRMGDAQALQDSVHALAQPLTALLFLLDLGSRNPDPQAWHATLDDARTECLRAVEALDKVRSAAHALVSTGDVQ